MLAQVSEKQTLGLVGKEWKCCQLFSFLLMGSASSLPSYPLLIEVTVLRRALPAVTFPGFSSSISITAVEHCGLFIWIALSLRQRKRSLMLWDFLFTRAPALPLTDPVLWFLEQPFLGPSFINPSKQYSTESKTFF